MESHAILKKTLSACLVLFSLSLLFICCSPIWAEQSEAIPSELSNNTTDDVEAEETAQVTSPEGSSSERVANSWRFSNGVPIDLAGSQPAPLSVDGAWEKSDAGYINSAGEVIPGAIARGIDVSEWQYSIDWSAVKNDDVSFAIIRAAAWNGEEDSYWRANASECTRLGIPFGAYIYSYASTPSEARNEADYILSLVDGYDLSYPIYIDLEDYSIAGCDLNSIAAAFCERIEAAGYEAGVYANTSWWESKLTSSELDNWDKWIAQYNVECTYTGQYDMWQATSLGGIDGVAGNTDINFVYSEDTFSSIELSNSSIVLGDSITVSPILSVSDGWSFNYIWQYNGAWDEWSSTLRDTGSFTSDLNWSFQPQKAGAYKISIEAESPRGIRIIKSATLAVRRLARTPSTLSPSPLGRSPSGRRSW